MSPSSLPTAKSLSLSSKQTNAPIVDFELNKSSIRTLTFPEEALTKQSLPSEELHIKSNILINQPKHHFVFVHFSEEESSIFRIGFLKGRVRKFFS